MEYKVRLGRCPQCNKDEIYVIEKYDSCLPCNIEVTSMFMEHEVMMGVEYLNQYHKGWIDKIDLNDFNIEQMAKCIVGQLGIEEQVMKTFGVRHPTKLGFDSKEPVVSDNFKISYDWLQETWMSVLTKLKQSELQCT